jgi:hypothetical protein
MKKLLPILVLLFAVIVSSSLPARTERLQSRLESFSSIPNRIVNRVLKIAAREWSMTVGAAHQAYSAGSIIITPYPQGGENVYMVEYDGFCILAVLEDKL